MKKKIIKNINFTLLMAHLSKFEGPIFGAFRSSYRSVKAY